MRDAVIDRLGRLFIKRNGSFVAAKCPYRPGNTKTSVDQSDNSDLQFCDHHCPKFLEKVESVQLRPTGSNLEAIGRRIPKSRQVTLHCGGAETIYGISADERESVLLSTYDFLQTGRFKWGGGHSRRFIGWLFKSNVNSVTKGVELAVRQIDYSFVSRAGIFAAGAAGSNYPVGSQVGGWSDDLFVSQDIITSVQTSPRVLPTTDISGESQNIFSLRYKWSSDFPSVAPVDTDGSDTTQNYYWVIFEDRTAQGKVNVEVGDYVDTSFLSYAPTSGTFETNYTNFTATSSHKVLRAAYIGIGDLRLTYAGDVDKDLTSASGFSATTLY